MNNMKKYLSLTDKKGTSGGSRRQGGLSNVPLTSLMFYIEYIGKSRAKRKNKQWLPSIQEFSDLISSDPVLRMNWEYGIYLCNETLEGKTPEDVIDMIDTVCKTPPSFSHSSLVGFPVNAIFVQFMQNQNGRMFFSHERVNQAIKKILNDYGKMLQSPASCKYLITGEHGWFSPQADAVIHNQWYICDPNLPHYGYKNWNQWFLRQFKEGMRPMGEGTPEGIDPFNVIVNSCQSAPLSLPQQPQTNVQYSDKFWFKDDVYSLNDMFGGQRYNKQKLAQHFEGGTVYQAFLSALYYHRWHSPVDGIIEDVYAIDGTYYLDQSQFIGYDEGSPNNSQSFLSAVAARKVIVIKADNKKIGRIAIVYIGMAEVSSCVSIVKIGQKVKKGQQIGYFMFGGSSHAMVFEKKVNLKFRNKLYAFNKQTESFESQKQNLFSYLAHVVTEQDEVKQRKKSENMADIKLKVQQISAEPQTKGGKVQQSGKTAQVQKQSPHKNDKAEK